jgi:hypothetical protein
MGSAEAKGSRGLLVPAAFPYAAQFENTFDTHRSNAQTSSPQVFVTLLIHGTTYPPGHIRAASDIPPVGQLASQFGARPCFVLPTIHPGPILPAGHSVGAKVWATAASV